MHAPPPEPPIRKPRQGITSWRPEIPAWLISMLLHLSVLTVLGLTLRLAPQPAAGTERTAEVGIVLKHQEGQKEYYVGEQDGGSQSPAAAARGATSLADALRQPSPLDPSRVLPKVPSVIGPGALDGGGVASAGKAASGPGAGRELGGGKGRTSFAGIEAEGYKFAYVLDRSASMDGSGRSPLDFAKSELLASLRSLGKTHQFLIVFYNEQPTVFNPSGQKWKLAFANEQNKNRARRFIGSITAAGGTRHEQALLAAIHTQPDVIFFLTDGDEPRLSAAQLDHIRREAGGISINTVEFGFGPKSGSTSFLAKLAGQNHGKYVYIDISGLNAARPRQP
jgi:hypothetical protein